MSRGVQAFKQTDAVKALKAAKNAGLDVQRFEIDRTGKIVIIIGKVTDDMPASAAGAIIQQDGGPNEWDAVK
jgi:hypothetical protein